MNEDETLTDPWRRGGHLPCRSSRGLHSKHRGTGRGRGGNRIRSSERGTKSMESLNASSSWMHISGNHSGCRPRTFGNRKGRGYGTGQGQDDSQNRWRFNSNHVNGEKKYNGTHGRRKASGACGGSQQTRGDSANLSIKSCLHTSGKRQIKGSVSSEELVRLTTLQPDLLVYELLSDKSGFLTFIEQGSFTFEKMDLTVKILARVTTSQSNRDTMYKLLNKTCVEQFLAKVMNYSLTLKREHSEKGYVFFAELHTVLETFANAMTTVAIKRLVNLVDGCHTALVTMEVEGHVEDCLVNKYKALLEFLTEAKKRWGQEEMEHQGRRKMAERNIEPPDDFREMSIFPTQMDIAATNNPFLRKNVVSGCYADGDHYLDVQFRLMHEDFVRPLRVGIGQLRSVTKPRITDIRIYRNVTIIGFKAERQRVFHRVQLQSMKRMELENSKRFMYGNLVCISRDNFSTMVLGSVADRSPKDLKKGIIGIEIESDISDFDMSGQFTMIESRAFFVAYKHVLQALKEMPENIPMEKYVVHVQSQINTPQYLDQEETYDLRMMKTSTLMMGTRAYKNFSRQRQGKDQAKNVNTLPESMQLQAVQVTRLLPDWPSEADLGLDSSQRHALRSALTRELAIIQGPPGTGKTFIGLKIVQTLLNNRQVWKAAENPTPILVVGFTNHALDQFLEGMTSFTMNIVRVGSQTQSQIIDSFQINKLVKKAIRCMSLPQSIHDAEVVMSRELNRLEEQINMCEKVDYECGAARGIFHLSVFSDNVIPVSVLQQLQQASNGEEITHWLMQNHKDQGTSELLWQELSALTVQGKPSQQQQQQQAPCAEEGCDIDEDAFKDALEFIETEERDRRLEDDTEELVVKWVNKVRFEVTKKNLERDLEIMKQRSQEKKEDADAYLECLRISKKLQTITDGLEIPVNSQAMEALETNPNLNIWRLEPSMRWQLYNHWVAKLQTVMKAAQNNFIAAVQKNSKIHKEIKNAEYLHVMRRADIVAMTTTGAARFNSILRDLAPAIVVIEEAAEILESHVITSLTAHCQHLIMIGDHKQLQPSTTVYELGTKYGLSTSLFERMINNGLEYETLEHQHRMRPEISRLLVPSIYPSLKDHPSVKDYPRVLGMAHNVFFLTHHEHERMESDDNNSHENRHEAELMIGLCRHLLLQGYKPEEITILTTYSGQFFLLKKLQRQNSECTQVRIAVVDNYQGEESKIILLSLVRSNAEGKVGFLRTDNRVCVALSRAKHGLYITGNMDLLSESSKLWRKIHGDLLQSGSLGPAFTLRCENHPHRLATVATGGSFLVQSPEGGCMEVCAKPLPKCQHTCPRKCHVDDPKHTKSMCMMPCPKTLCSLEHMCPKFCHQECGLCVVMLPKVLPCNHTHRIPCHVPPESYKCPTKVEKVIPACEHIVTMKCHVVPSTFTCPKMCDMQLDCGHKCKGKCHCTNDPDHQTYLCLETCTKINVSCTQQHMCRKKCHEKCGLCEVKVIKTLPCGHEENDTECSKPVEEIQCNKNCKKTLPCGHKCKKLCYKECGGCSVAVKKVVSACGHSITTTCSEPATTEHCDGLCPKTLPCGHPCRAKCKDLCTSECPELVVSAEKCPKGHVIKLPCYLSTTVLGEAAWKYCTAPCNKNLDCEHQCVGTCSSCLQGRLHHDCWKPCQKPLICGHICNLPCSYTCLPCNEKCQWNCSHNKRDKKCSSTCLPCTKKCTISCKHKTCKKRCGEECEWSCKHNTGDRECRKDCSQKPCEEPCRKKLECGHECVGLCGDSCPPLCRVCDHEKLTECVLLGSEEPDARFVLLEDCGHCIEAKGLERWLRQEDINVGMKTCPTCRSPIFSNRRYQGNVLQAYKAVQDIKKKYSKACNNIKQGHIELMLEDEEIRHCFKSECVMLLKKIGVGPRPTFPRRPFETFSIGEKVLCHFKAQVLKKATAIINQPQATELNTTSEHLAVVRSMVEVVVARVMKATAISPQTKREVSCELQRLAVLPAYWTFLEKSAVCPISQIMAIRMKVKLLMDPTVIYDEGLDKQVRALLRESEEYFGDLRISSEERIIILPSMDFHQGHWYKCPNGHIFCITGCEGAMEQRICPECGSHIGGNHGLKSDSALTTEINGELCAVQSEQNTLGNSDFDIQGNVTTTTTTTP